MSTQIPKKRAHHITVQHVGLETLLYDEDRNQAFCLNAISAAVWNLSDGCRSIEQIASDATIRLSNPVTVELVEYALAQLERDGMLDRQDGADLAALASAAPSRRAVMQNLCGTSFLLLPAIAAIAAPRAAQAYSGCFDCSNSLGAQRGVDATRAAAAQSRIARQRSQSRDPAGNLEQK